MIESHALEMRARRKSARGHLLSLGRKLRRRRRRRRASQEATCYCARTCDAKLKARAATLAANQHLFDLQKKEYMERARTRANTTAAGFKFNLLAVARTHNHKVALTRAQAQLRCVT